MTRSLSEVMAEREEWPLWELADLAGIEVRTLERRLRGLMNEGKVERFNGANNKFKWRLTK